MTNFNRDVDSAYQRASELKTRLETELLKKANVVGVGVGLRQRDGEVTEEIALIVMVKEKVPISELAPEDHIPAEINDVPIDVLEVGLLQAEDNEGMC
jgi:hypothetical protein